MYVDVAYLLNSIIKINKKFMIYYNPIKNTLSNTGKTIKIGYRESQILTLLLENSPDVVKKLEIVQFAWGSEYVGETSLAKSISVLRQALVKLGIVDSPIVTVPKIGYRLIEGVVINECLMTDEGTEPEVKVDNAKQHLNEFYKHEPNFRHLACYVVSLGILFAASLVGASKFHSKSNHSQKNLELNVHAIGSLEVYVAPNSSLSIRLEQLLAQHQCDCVVYIEENEHFSELSWLYKPSRKSINVFYTQTQFEQASQSIAQFIAEEKR